jgi:PAS domain S-box-containing protein
VTGLVFSLVETTERKRAEEALRKSGERYRILLDYLPDLVMVHREGTIIYVNPALIDTLGVRQEDILNRSVFELIPPEYHARVAAAIRRRLETGREDPYEIEIPLRRRRRLFSSGSVSNSMALRHPHVCTI